MSTGSQQGMGFPRLSGPPEGCGASCSGNFCCLGLCSDLGLAIAAALRIIIGSPEQKNAMKVLVHLSMEA